MSDAITVKKSVLDDILEQLGALQRKVLALKRTKTQSATIKKKTIKYGSEEWWDKEMKLADEDIKKGRYKTFNSAKELIADLKK